VRIHTVLHLFLGVVLLAVPAFADSPFLINETTADDQVAVSLAPLPGGGFVATWMSRVAFPPGPPDVRARRFDAGGAPLGGEFPVNDPGGEHWAPVVVTDSLGAFAIVWRVEDSSTSTYGIYGRRYDAAGAPVGAGAIELVDGLTGFYDVAAGPGGDGVLAWIEEGDTTRVWARSVDSALATGARRLVAEYPESFTSFVAVDVDPAGDYAVAWTAPDGANRHVRARAYDAAGSPLTPELAVTAQSALNADPDIALSAGGEITVVWWSGQDSVPPSEVMLRRFDAAGAPLSGEAIVSDPIGAAAVPAVAVDGAGNLAVAWSVQYASESGSDGWQIRGRRFHSDGTPDGPSMLVSEFHPDASGPGSLYPDVLLGDDGTLTAAWSEQGFTDADVYGNIISAVATGVTPALATSLLDNRPNPFNPSTEIRFAVPRAGHTTLAVFDVAGHRVRTLVDGDHPSGVFTLSWDGRDDSGRPLASGVYLCTLASPGQRTNRKLVLLK
jgi:hypothetical protein